jgi:NTE family protein
MVVGMPSAIAPNIELQTRSQRPGGQYDTLFRGSSWRPSLIHIGAFAELSLEQLTALEQHLITIPVSRGEVLVREGDDADALYLVVSGHFVVEAGGRRVAEICGGAPIGEIAFFANGKRTATVRAHRDSIVL